LPAFLDLLLVAEIFYLIAFSAAEKPAEMPALKLPGWAFMLDIALFFFPAGGENFVAGSLFAKKKEQLAFYMRGYLAPALLIAVNCFECHSEKLGKFFLRFTKFLSRDSKIFLVQTIPSRVLSWGLTVHPLFCKVMNICYIRARRNLRVTAAAYTRNSYPVAFVVYHKWHK